MASLDETDFQNYWGLLKETEGVCNRQQEEGLQLLLGQFSHIEDLINELQERAEYLEAWEIELKEREKRLPAKRKGASKTSK
ncbi:MAG: hypothetical protein MPJ24_10725 [Pirellulaceae bacterium]|nr:hypothetical protein [Pirellulaceae bacterium]